MSSVVVNYAAVRFLPYRETDEFVNVGVVIYCPDEDHFAFKLVKGRSSRVHRFFPELNKDVLRKSLEAFKGGLSRLRKNFDLGESGSAREADIQSGMGIFRELVRPRESILHFSSAGSLVAESWQKALKELYDRYVERRIASSPQEQERRIQLRLASLFTEWHFKKFYRMNRRLGDKENHATWNLVAFDESGERTAEHAIKAFKALSLDRKDASKIYFYGDGWIKRVERLKQRGLLPQQTVFALRMPDESSRQKAALEIAHGLNQGNTVAVTLNETERIRKLAEIPVRGVDGASV